MSLLLKEKYRGAESKLFTVEWLGIPAIAKKRLPKKYRIPELDFYFRKQRTIYESRLISRAKTAGVKTPFIYEIDITNTTIVMELIEGEILKTSLPRFSLKKQKEICEKIGILIGLLHKASIVHGDLTTSNIILLPEENDLVFVDFGLGYITDKLEDFGIDIYLLERAFISTHAEIFENIWQEVILGYKKTSPYGNVIEEKLIDISSRGRYSDRT